MENEPKTQDNGEVEDGSKDQKKLSKGQLKKLKEKTKKDEKGEPEKEAQPPASDNTETNGTTQTEEQQKEDEDEEGAGGDAGDLNKKGLSKGQLKKLKEKAKKEEKPAQAAEEKKEAKEEETEKGDKKDKKKGKKTNAAAELIKQRLEEQRRMEEEIKKREEELRRQEEEEMKRIEEENRRLKELEEQRKREKEQRKKELIAKGEFKTRKEREREAALLKRREELINAGIVSADHFEQTTEKPKSKAVRTKKLKPKKDNENQGQEGQTEDKNQEDGDKQENEQKDFENWEEELEGRHGPRQKNEDEEDTWDTFDQEGTGNKKEEGKPKQGKEEKPQEKAQEKPKEKTEKGEKNTKGVEDKDSKKGKPEPEPVESKEGSKEVVVNSKNNKKHTPDEPKQGPQDKIRSPIICILGHVDTGKTKLLDKMRNTNVQEGEAGGITQQIGATFFPYEKLQEEVAKIQAHYPMELQVPGLLIIDTPGHESFSNLRSRGSGLCDIAILVVDIMHGLEKQTLESIELLKFRKTPFVIALNKIDRIYGWKSKKDTSSVVSLKKQDKNCQLEFRDRSKQIITELTEKGFNVALYYDNPDPNTYVSIVPTSALTGEGISDLLGVAINLTQKWLKKKITRKGEFKCTVLEVKVIEGLGASIDVMLIDGTLNEGDRIVLAGYEGPIVTYVRALLTPHPMKEMRVKNEYIHHKSIDVAMGIKISANDLEKALAGSELYVAKNDDEVEIYKRLVEEEITKVKKSIKLVDEGVLVAASTLGSLEALLQFLKSSHIPVSSINIGPISKAEVIKAMKPLQITEGEIKKEFATILAFDVKVLQDAKELAEQEGVKIFTANIIYHLFDHFTAYLKELQEERKRNEGKLAVFPAILKPVAFFNMKDPIVMGLDVVEGQLRIGTPICVVDKNKLRIGVVESIEKEHKPILIARPSDGSVAVKIKGDTSITAGRHFELKDKFVSIISRESIDALKKYFRDEMSKADWELVKKLKPLFGVI